MSLGNLVLAAQPQPKYQEAQEVLATASAALTRMDIHAKNPVHQDFACGRPVDLEAKKDYWRLGMDAGKAKDYREAARYLRYAYYQSMDSYRLFWYLNWMDAAWLSEALIAEASQAPVDQLWHKAYQNKSAILYAQALLRSGRREAALQVLLEAFQRHPAADLAGALTAHSWKYDTAGPIFRAHPDYLALISQIVKDYGLDPASGQSLIYNLFEHLMVSAALYAYPLPKNPVMADSSFSTNEIHKLVGNYEPPWNKKPDLVIAHALLGLLDQMAKTWADKPDVLNLADWQVVRRSLKYFLDHYPAMPPGRSADASPFRFVWMNLYLPRVDGLYQTTKGLIPLKSQTDLATIVRRINDTSQEYALTGVLYYWFTQGQILYDWNFTVLDATATALDNKSTIQSIITEAVEPYPGDLLYGQLDQFDGLMWWFPPYEGIAYLGGPKPLWLVPGFLQSSRQKSDWRMFTKMPGGAGWRVLTHEIHHNHAALSGLDSSHGYTEAEKKSWFPWYQDIVKNNSGKTSELAWYEGQSLGQGEAGTWAHFKGRSQEWKPTTQVFALAREYADRTGKQVQNQVQALLDQASKAQASKGVDKEIKLLQEARKSGPLMPETLFRLAYALHWHKKDSSSAYPLYDQYLKEFAGFNDHDVALVYALGWRLNKDPRTGLEMLRALGQNPGSNQHFSEFRLLEARFLAKLNQIDEARERARALLTDPRNTLGTEVQDFLDKLPVVKRE